ncbi:MAG: OmpA family protein [Myxococcota bacterium]|nr:OmpA family protein [Myxococcota bacterium]
MVRGVTIVGLVLAMAAFSFSGCRPQYPNCDNDDHCQEGEYCVNNLCQQCRDSGDCPVGQECQGGACREIEGYCTQSSDCAEGQVCRDNRCGPCLSDADCGGDNVCLNGKCGKGECRSTEECPAGTSCVNYRCIPDTSGQDTGQHDCIIEPIFFAFDSAEVTADMRRKAEKNYDCLVKRGGSVSLTGHCDPRGTTEYNMALGERRARIVSKIIKTLGFDASKVRIVSKGEEEATGTDESGWAKDRRVEFR